MIDYVDNVNRFEALRTMMASLVSSCPFTAGPIMKADLPSFLCSEVLIGMLQLDSCSITQSDLTLNQLDLENILVDSETSPYGDSKYLTTLETVRWGY